MSHERGRQGRGEAREYERVIRTIVSIDETMEYTNERMRERMHMYNYY